MRKVLLAVFAFCQILVFAQIETDRPDFTESPNVVPKGALQLETGFVHAMSFNEYESKYSTTVTDNTLNTGLLRYGISDKTEFRLNWSVNQIETKGMYPDGRLDLPYTQTGVQPIFVGIKHNLHQGKTVTIGFLAHLYLPFLASKTFSVSQAAPEFLLPISVAVSDRFSVSAQLGMSWDGDNPEPEASYTLSLAYAITDQLGAYFEPYGYKNTSHAFGERDNRYNGGFTFLVNDNFQLDASAGAFNGDGGFGSNYFISGGFSYLFQP